MIKTKQDLLDELREWILCTGVFNLDSSWAREVESFVEDAFDSGAGLEVSDD